MYLNVDTVVISLFFTFSIHFVSLKLLWCLSFSDTRLFIEKFCKKHLVNKNQFLNAIIFYHKNVDLDNDTRVRRLISS